MGVGIGVGEGVDRAAIDVDLVVGLGFLHFLLEGGDGGGGNEGIISAVADEDFGVDVVGAFVGGAGEIAVKADDAGEGSAGTGKFEDDGAAEAVTDAGDAVLVGVFIVYQGGEGGLAALRMALRSVRKGLAHSPASCGSLVVLPWP